MGGTSGGKRKKFVAAYQQVAINLLRLPPIEIACIKSCFKTSKFLRIMKIKILITKNELTSEIGEILSIQSEFLGVYRLPAAQPIGPRFLLADI